MPDLQQTVAALEEGLALALGLLAEGAEPRVRLALLSETEAPVSVLEVQIAVPVGGKFGYDAGAIELLDVEPNEFAAQFIAMQLVALSHELITQAEALAQLTPELILEQLGANDSEQEEDNGNE